MLLRLSTLFFRTLREDPADAEVASHRLLVRAGYIRRAAPGIYTWLPLGLRVLAKVEAVVREEMTAAGAQEVHFPALLPKEPYEATGRWTEYGPNIFRLKDRKGGDYLLAPTHEEMFTLLVKDLYSSYKDLPLALFQIQTKYRDEARPRAGLIRGREFIMKDAYSFDVDDAGLEASYQAQRAAYQRIFDRLGLEYVIVAATSGAMGGSRSEEFLTPTAIGEDTFVRSAGGYAANVEAVTTVVPDALPFDDAPAAHVEDTPDTPTIDSLVAVANERFARPDRAWTAADTLKNVVLALVHPTGERELLVVGLPGDREVDLKRLEAAVAPAEVEAAGDADFAAHPELVRGYIGPGAMGPNVPVADGAERTAVRYLLDPRVVPGTRWITGANEPGRHVFDLVAGRDFTADGTVEAAEVRAGDPAPDGSGAARAGPRHRDRPHLRARPQVRGGARPDGAGPERQGAGRHDGLVRHRRDPRARRARRGEQRRARPGLAGARGAGARDRRRDRQGPGRLRGGRGAGRRAVVARHRGHLRRPPGPRLARREVRRRRAPGRPARRRRRPRAGRGRRRGPPAHRRHHRAGPGRPRPPTTWPPSSPPCSAA